MRLQNGEPPRNAGDGLPIERLGNRLDDQFLSPNLSAQTAAVPTQGLPRERLDVLPPSAFAPVIIVRGRRYHRKVDIEDFVDRLVEATASGEVATTAPNPHRTPAKKRLGGVVTG